MKDEKIFHEQIKGNYEFVVTNIGENHTETATYSTIEQVLHKIKLDLDTSCCHDLLDTIQIKVKRK